MARTVELYDGGYTSYGGGTLWITDGTALGTGSLASPALGSFAPLQFVELGHGLVVFNASYLNIKSLFVTDGTAAGTSMIPLSFKSTFGVVSKPNLPQNPLTDLTELAPGKVLFAGDDGTHGQQLWVTDGSAAGTVMLATINPNAPNYANINSITPLGNGRAVFQATDVTGSASVWVTDGTTAGTAEIAGYSGASNLNLTGIGKGKVILTYGGSVYVTDGTLPGTGLLRAGLIGPRIYNGGGADAVPLLDGRTLFAGTDATNGAALWVTDGTPGGTVLLENLQAGAGGAVSAIQAFQPLGGNRFVFEATVGSRQQLWVTDGTAARTSVIRSFLTLNVGTPGTNSVATANGLAVFAADDGVHGLEPWVTDGTTAGTGLLADIASGPPASYAQQFTRLPDGLVTFQATNQPIPSFFGQYTTDGTVAGTQLIGGPGSFASASVSVRGPDPLFDETYYLAQNPDVAASHLDPYQHWLQYGAAEGRNPDAFFDTKYYLAQNPDVAASGLNPLTHYELYGWQEGRDPSLLFSTSGYEAGNLDVGAAHIDPLFHELYYGQGEGRMTFLAGGSAPADPLVVASYYDPQLGATLVPTGIAAAQQAAASYGATEWHAGLNPDPFFNTSYYLSHNPDVAAAGLNPVTHYELYGWREGRDPSAAFSTTKYLAGNPDVKMAGLDPLQHYLQYGQAEGRVIYPA